VPIYSSNTKINNWRRWVSDQITGNDTDISTLQSQSLTLLETAATTSGTSVTIGSVPAGTQKIDIVFSGVSLDGSNDLRIRLGDSGGIETSGYESDCSRFTATGVTTTTATGSIRMSRAVADNNNSGVISAFHVGSNKWVFAGSLNDADSSTNLLTVVGEKTLSGELTQIELTPASSDNFDAGSVTVFTTG